MFRNVLIMSIILVFPGRGHATASSNLWAPSTALCQSFGVPHLTYDSYFRKGPGMTSGHPSAYPTTYGLTVGFLPFTPLQGEIGWDMILPSEDPHVVNGKLCTPESSIFSGSPAVSVGAYGMGFKKNVTDQNILYLMFQKTLPGVGGNLALGLYHGTNRNLFTNSDGKVVQTGIIAALVSPDVELGLKGLRKMNFLVDLQTGKNALGAWAVGTNVYFADNVSLLVGPTFLFDRKAQPDSSDLLWAMELDIDLPLERL